MAVQLKKSMVIIELEKGGSVKSIAERLGITIPLLKKAAKTFGLNLRKKPKTEAMEFIDDTDEVTFTDEGNKDMPFSHKEVESNHKVSMLM